MKYNSLVKEKKRISNNDSVGTIEERKIVENKRNNNSIKQRTFTNMICISLAIYIKFHFKSEWYIYKNKNNNNVYQGGLKNTRSSSILYTSNSL